MLTSTTTPHLYPDAFLELKKTTLSPERNYLKVEDAFAIKYGNKGYSLDQMQDLFRGKKCTTKNY